MLDGSLHYVQCVSHASIVQIFLLFSMIWYRRIQSPAVSIRQDVRWCNFHWWIKLSIGYVWNYCIHRASRFFHAHIAYETDTAKIIAACCRISYSLHDLVRLNSIVAMFKPHDVRWCGLRCSIPILIDYVWSVYVDKAISTSWYSYCILNSYIRNHHW